MKAMRSSRSTTAERLKRLKKRGEITGGGNDGWAATA